MPGKGLHSRSRTGCLTCRRRRKKCDERKPTCWNCERNNLECDGYQAPIKWKSQITAALVSRQDTDGSLSSESAQQEAHDTLSAQSDKDAQTGNGASPTGLDPTSLIHHPDTYNRPVNDPNSPSTSRSCSPTTIAGTSPGSSSFGSRSEPRRTISAERSSILPTHVQKLAVVQGNDIQSHRLLGFRSPTSSHHISPSTSPTLPFIINGIQSASEKRLLHHFIHVLSPRLVLHSNPAKNPFNQIVLPMALYDEACWGLFDLLLSFSASHLIRLLLNETQQQHTAETRFLENIKWKRYGHAIKRHASNLSSVLNQEAIANEASQFGDDNEINYAVATTMLLCQWSTCEGGDQSPWRLHLNASRELVRKKVEGWHGIFEPLSAASQMLLEWFFLHDIISSVTFPSSTSTCCIDLHRGTIESFGNSVSTDPLSTIFGQRPVSDILWIGPNDGLLAILARVLGLRQQRQHLNAQESATENSSGSSWTSSYPRTPNDIPNSSSSYTTKQKMPRRASTALFGKSIEEFDTTQFFEALAIEDTLRDWSFDYTSSSQLAVGRSYQCAAYIMLHFTIYQTFPLNDPKVRDLVEPLIQNLALISEADNAQTCSLLPIFICGVTVQRPEDRYFVIEKARSYSRWSGMGYIDDVIGFLEDWWQEQDRVSLVAAASNNPTMHLSEDDTQQRDSSWWEWETFMRQRKLQLILV